MSSRSKKEKARTTSDWMFAVPKGRTGALQWSRDMPARQVNALLKRFPRPIRRGQCEVRPCPYISCRYHLWSDYVSRGCRQDPKKYAAWVARDPLEAEETCALDVAERGGETLENIGALFQLTRERIRQIEACALRKIRDALAEEGIGEQEAADMFSDKTDQDAWWPRPIQVIGQPDKEGDLGDWGLAALRAHCEELAVSLDEDDDLRPSCRPLLLDRPGRSC